MKGETRGFTIVEVLLFLSISALLFVIALSFTGGTIREANFTDESNQLASFIQRQFYTVKNIESSRDDTLTAACDAGDTPEVPGASNTCMVLGKLLFFDDDKRTIKVATIVGDAGATIPTAGQGEAATLAQSSPRVLSNGTTIIVDDTFTFSGRMQFTQQKMKTGPSSEAPFNAVAIMRSPVSEKVYSVSWNVIDSPPGQGELASTYYNSSDPSIGIRAILAGAYDTYGNKPLLVCGESMDIDDRRVAVAVQNDQSVGSIQKSGILRNEPISGGWVCDL